jgi:hypothetical protein
MNSPGLVESLAAASAASVALVEPAASVELTRRAQQGSTARAELLHRHLVARLQAAKSELRQLEGGAEVPEELVLWLGAVVAERRSDVEASRAEIRDRAVALVRAADARAAELVAAAESEARVLRAVGTWLRSVPTARAALSGMPTASIGPGRRAEEAR